MTTHDEWIKQECNETMQCRKCGTLVDRYWMQRDLKEEEDMIDWCGPCYFKNIRKEIK